MNRPEPDPGAAATTDPSRSAERPGSEVPSITAVDEAAVSAFQGELDRALAYAAGGWAPPHPVDHPHA